jgi:hypothetical protein
MSRYRFEPAVAADDAALRARMAADWLQGSLSVSFRREPSYFAGCALQGEQVQVHKCVDTASSELVGMGARLATRLCINGEWRRVGLLSDLRLAAHARGGTLVARGYRVLRTLHEADPVDFYLTVILDGNRTAIGSIASGRAGLPTYRDFGRMLSPAIPLDWPKPALALPGIRLRRAATGEEGAVLELLAAAAPRRQFTRDWSTLAPGLSIADFFVAERGSRLVACVAAWDQHALRQTFIEAYSPALAAVRPFYNAAARLLPLKPLPAPGTRIPYVYLAAVAVLDDDLALWRALLRHAYRDLRHGPWHHAIVSLHEDDPLAAALADYRAIRAAGRIYVVHYGDGAAAVAALDRRIPCLDLSRI